MKKWLKILILILLLFCYGVFLWHKIDLTTSDLGRHIKNGEEILGGNFNVLYTNFYSYTFPDYPFVNHHWLSGMGFYALWNFFGFAGLQLFFIILSLAAFWFFFDIAVAETGWKIAAPVSLFLIPLIAERTEVRPEVFSYFLAGLFFWMLWKHKRSRLSERWLWVLPILMIFWANLHVYFFIGIFILGIFLLANFKLWKIFSASAVAILINPFGYRAILFPVYALRHYGYRIVENQSVWFLEKLGLVENPNYFWFWLVALILLILGIMALLKKERDYWILFLPALAFGVMAAFAIRNFTIFALFAMPAVSAGIRSGFKKLNTSSIDNYVIGAIISALILVITFFSHQIKIPPLAGGAGIGLMEANESSGKFLLDSGVKGPIFNNYDIGSFLIFYLEPRNVFVDNRPEAYPASFFENLYIPMEENEEKWREAEKKYNFNAIVFAWHDYTPWGQNFLASRMKDPEWALVFMDKYAAIFLKK